MLVQVVKIKLPAPISHLLEEIMRQKELSVRPLRMINQLLFFAPMLTEPLNAQPEHVTTFQLLQILTLIAPTI
jgi:hypothetical protein